MSKFDIILINEAIPAEATAAKQRVGELLTKDWEIYQVLLVGEKPPVFGVVLIRHEITVTGADGLISVYEAEG